MGNQRTLGGEFAISGVGLHTGLTVNATFKPAEAGHGIKFRRTDIEGDASVVDALAENIVETNRGTVIAKGEAKISTIEHAMSALFALGVDNCLIEVDQPEMPILDGSAKLYVEKINEVGITDQDAERDYYIIRHKTEFTATNGAKYTFLPDDVFSASVVVEYDSPVLNNQYAQMEDASQYSEQISGCRTFVFVREIEQLIKAGLIKGGDLDNAIVIYDKEMEQSEIDSLCDSLGKKHISASSLGYLNTEPLRFTNEPARHKLLDLIGDLALIGKPIKGRITVSCPGHTSNAELTKKLRKEIKRSEVSVPVYDVNVAPLMDVNRIREILPHRYPFQLVDKVVELTQWHIVAIKNVTANEEFFCGHFPTEPVMPGVLIVEAMAQAGGLLVLGSLDDPCGYSTYFMKIDNVKFRQKVVPGDTLVFKVEYMTPLRRGCAVMKSYAFVGDKIVAEAEYMAQITKNK